MAKGLSGSALRDFRSLFNGGAAGRLTDGQLLERFGSGEGEAAECAFAALVERHGPMVLRVCRAILRDEHEAGDAFQAVFLVLVRKRVTIRVTGSLGPWLHQVAYRVASCARSAAARRRRHEGKAAELAGAPTYEGRDQGELAAALHEEIDRLPNRYRAPVLLCCLEGFTQEQAARQLGCPIGTVQSRLARGRERLRDRLTRRGLAPSAALTGTAVAARLARAAVPKGLANSAVRAAVRISVGKASFAEVVSAGVVAMAEGALSTMFLTKLRFSGLALLLAGLAATGAGVWAGQETGPRDEPSRPVQARVGGPEVVARVNGVPITRDQLIERCLARHGAGELEALIRLEVVRDAGQRRGIRITDDEAAAEAARLAKAAGTSTDAWFRGLAEQRGIPKDRYLREFIAPDLTLKGLGGSGPDAVYQDLRRKADVEVLDEFRQRPGRDRDVTVPPALRR